MPLASYHNHTPLCRHARGTAGEFVAAARAAGLVELGISDHCPWRVTLDDWRMDRCDWAGYLAWVEQARAAAGPDLPVRLGLEVDWIRGERGWLEALRGWAKFDYWIGAVHYLEPGWDFDHPDKAARIDAFGVEPAWERYFELYEEMVRSGWFQIAAHPDLIKKFGHRSGAAPARWADPIVEALAQTGTAVEINTAGWDKPCAEQYPSLDFLRRCRRRGVGLVISADAHRPQDVARHYDRAVAVAKEAGYAETLRFAGGEVAGTLEL